MKWQGFLVNLIATIFIWLSVGMLTEMGGSGYDGVINFALIAAFGTTLGLWAIWALSQSTTQTPQPATEQEKMKRSGSDEDTRLALLLKLMDDDEREALKQRLIDDLGADGETITLAQLLDQQNSTRRAR